MSSYSINGYADVCKIRDAQYWSFRPSLSLPTISIPTWVPILYQVKIKWHDALLDTPSSPYSVTCFMNGLYWFLNPKNTKTSGVWWIGLSQKMPTAWSINLKLLSLSLHWLSLVYHHRQSLEFSMLFISTLLYFPLLNLASSQDRKKLQIRTKKVSCLQWCNMLQDF